MMKKDRACPARRNEASASKSWDEFAEGRRAAEKGLFSPFAHNAANEICPRGRANPHRALGVPDPAAVRKGLPRTIERACAMLS